MERKQLRVMRGLKSLALLSLIIGAILTVIEGLFGNIMGITLAVTAALITLYCYRHADSKAPASREYYLWRYLPTLLFVAVPLIVYVVIRLDRGWTLEGLLLLLRVTASFLIPIACLLYIESKLKRAQY